MIRLWWVALLCWAGSLGLRGGPIVVSELNYNPLDGSDYEFIELLNTGTSPFNLTGATFTNGVEYVFQSTVLQAGQRLVICADRSKFTERYGAISELAPSRFKKSLKDEGEEITLVSAVGQVLFQFKYDSNGKWPSRANGLGSSLEVVDPKGNLSDPDNWRSSAEYNGSPGRAGVGTQRSVVINEVLAHTDPPLEDAIELYNNSSSPIDISNWFISNSRATPFKFKIPKGTVIPANGFKVFYEYQFNKLGDADAFTFNSAHGDEAVLLSADASGNPLLWMDATTFEASENGYSFARYPNGSGPLVIASDLSFGTSVRSTFPESFLNEFRKGTGASNPPPRVGPLIISRFQFAPPTTGDEFIEIQNISQSVIPLFDPLYPTNSWTLDNAIQFVFPNDLWLAPGEKVIVSGVSPTEFKSRQSIASDVVAVLGPWTGLLNNAGDRIALFKPDPPQGQQHPDFGFVPYILVEEISYSPNAPWPVGSNNAYALRRKTTGYGNDPLNWTIDTPLVVNVSIAPKLSGNAIQLTFDIPAGTVATVETRRDPSSGNWAVAQSFPAQAATRSQTYSYSLEGGQRVFRVLFTQ